MKQYIESWVFVTHASLFISLPIQIEPFCIAALQTTYRSGSLSISFVAYCQIHQRRLGVEPDIKVDEDLFPQWQKVQTFNQSVLSRKLRR